MKRKNNDSQISPGLKISDLINIEKFGLTILAGKGGTEEEIYDAHLQKPGLIMAGHVDLLSPEKVQIFGLTEITYLRELDEKGLKEVVDNFFSKKLTCLIITNRLVPPPYLLEVAENKDIPVLQTSGKTSLFIRRLSSHLEKVLAPQTSLHGVLMSIQGVGILIIGKSGIGKSECALDLVSKGHRLVADDLIMLKKIGQEVIVGYGSDMIKHHMEIRGLGIINIKELFGVISVMDSARVELVIELMDWHSAEEEDRLGLEDETLQILGIDIPRIRIPVSPGRNISVILEVAARNFILKKSGYHSARQIDETLKDKLRKASAEKRGK